MTEFTDQDYLLHSQYKDATNFKARVALNRRFSVNKQGGSRWIFDQFQLGEKSKVLELGCGPGLLWLGNRERIPENWQIILTDFSPGMLEEARQRLGEERFSYQVTDAQALPFADQSFDAVIANYMLYHVPDLPKALAEIRRVLKPSGHFYAATFGREHMRELHELVGQMWPGTSWAEQAKNAAPFTLENGHATLAPFFAEVSLHTYEDALEVTEAEPLIAYALSGKAGEWLKGERREAFVALVEQKLAANGVIHITKDTGLFEARKE